MNWWCKTQIARETFKTLGTVPQLSLHTVLKMCNKEDGRREPAACLPAACLPASCLPVLFFSHIKWTSFLLTVLHQRPTAWIQQSPHFIQINWEPGPLSLSNTALAGARGRKRPFSSSGGRGRIPGNITSAATGITSGWIVNDFTLREKAARAKREDVWPPRLPEKVI